MTTSNIENAKKSDVIKGNRSRLNTRAILTKLERSYLEEGRPNDRHKEFLIKLKTKKALNEDLPLISQTRPDYLDVVTAHVVHHRTFDEGEPDEPMTAQIFEKRLKECILQLYWIYENELSNERKKAKVKSRVSEKRIFLKINAKLKESKANVHEIVEDIRKRQVQN